MARTKNTVTKSVIDELMDSCDIAVTTAFDKCTIVACKLPNGFVIVESSSCVDPANYDEDMGVDICMKNIEKKLWELEGYLLQNKLYMDGITFDDDDDDLECDGDCDNCDLFDRDDDDDIEDKKEEKQKHTDKKYEDDEYWDKLIQTYNDYLDYIDDYIDDLAHYNSRHRRRKYYYNNVWC